MISSPVSQRPGFKWNSKKHTNIRGSKAGENQPPGRAHHTPAAMQRENQGSSQHWKLGLGRHGDCSKIERPCSDFGAAGVDVCFQVFPWLLWLEVLAIVNGPGGGRELYLPVFLACPWWLEQSRGSWTGFLLKKRLADYPNHFAGWTLKLGNYLLSHDICEMQPFPSETISMFATQATEVTPRKKWERVTIIRSDFGWCLLLHPPFPTIRVFIVWFRDHLHEIQGCRGLLNG